MSFAPLKEPDTKPTTGDGDDRHRLWHIVCTCSEDHSFCGVELLGIDPTGPIPPEDQCLVCAQLAEGACPRCGA